MVHNIVIDEYQEAPTYVAYHDRIYELSTLPFRGHTVNNAVLYVRMPHGIA